MHGRNCFGEDTSLSLKKRQRIYGEKSIGTIGTLKEAVILEGELFI
jgi:hypothetical protein